MAVSRVRNGVAETPWGVVTTVTGWLILTASLASLAGPAGLLAGLAIGLLFLVLQPGPIALAAGHVIVLGLDVPATPVQWVIWFEMGFLAMLAGPLVGRSLPGRTLAVFLSSSVTLGAIGWFGWQRWDSRWLVGLALVSLVGLALYGVHRYAVVALETRVGRVES